jgi:pyrimidine deaminase RibD-like protein
MSLKYAIKIAEANDAYPKWKLGCVIKKGGAVQSVGWSMWKYDPMFIDDHSNCSTHAEVHALRQMRYDAHNCTMFVARALKGGGLGLAKPCVNCQTLIEDAGIKRVVFTVDNDRQDVWRPGRTN